MLSTYVDALPNLVNTETHRIHTTFNQSVAATGRLSSVRPNLQNIPIRTERGMKIREAFISRENYVLLAADYSQIELRIMASLSKDKSMLEAFNQNIDIHSATAAKVYKVALEDVTRVMRSAAKSVNFGIIYGISPYGLAKQLKCSANEAKDFISKLINNQKIETMIILGSGMGGFEENYDPLYQVDYSDIPNFLAPSVEGHAGKLSIVSINEKLTAILSGRAHYYEGYPIQDLVIPVRAFSQLGVKNLILTNAAGGISENYFPGDIISITDHINLTGNNPLMGKNFDTFGPRFPDMSEVYDKNFIKLALLFF